MASRLCSLNATCSTRSSLRNPALSFEANPPPKSGCDGGLPLRGINEAEHLPGFQSPRAEAARGPLDPVDAEELWRELAGEGAPDSPAAAARAIAEAWKLSPSPADVGAVAPSDKLILVGPGAVVAAIEAFAAGTDLDWAEQVAVIATPPGHRHLAAAGAALLNATKATRLFSADGVPAELSGRVVLSDDADAADRAAAEPFQK